MRFLSFSRDDKASFGAVIGDSVVDLGKRHPELPDLRQAIRDGRLGELAAEAAEAEADCSLGDITYLPTDATSFYLAGVPILAAFTGAFQGRVDFDPGALRHGEVAEHEVERTLVPYDLHRLAPRYRASRDARV